MNPRLLFACLALLPAPHAALLALDPPAAATPTVGGQARKVNVVQQSIQGETRTLNSNGWPDHAPGAFPRRGNPNAATPQSYSFHMPLHPQAAAEPVRRGGYWWGVAINGVPLEPGTAETWNNDRRSPWHYEASTGFLDLGLDEHNAHVQPSGAYHYHALPHGLIELHGGDQKQMLLVAWAADGFPVYTNRAHEAPGDAASPLRVMKPSYRLKAGNRPAEAGGPGGSYDGRFTQDFEYAAGSGDLDECNGRQGVTPEFPAGTYYYCITDGFPFIPRAWHGAPDPSFQKGEMRRGGPDGGEGPGGPGGNGRQRPGGPAGPGGAGAAGGGPEGGRPRLPLFEALDLNHDGALDAQEISRAAQSLQTLDHNHDGRLTGEEMFPPFPERGGPGGPGGGPPP